MGRASCYTKMKEYTILEIGMEIRDKDSGSWLMMKETTILASGIKIGRMAMENIIIVREIGYIRASGRKEWNRGLERSIILMESLSKEHIKMGLKMEKENIYFKMGVTFKVNLWMISLTVRGYKKDRIISMLDNGKIMISTAQANVLTSIKSVLQWNGT